MMVPVTDDIEVAPTLALFTSGLMRIPRQGEEEVLPDGTVFRGLRIILAVWEDGTVLWSKDELVGGPPYSKAQIDPKQLEEVLANMCGITESLPEGFKNRYTGPGRRWSTIAVRSETCNINWRSWHELAESTGRLVAVDGSLRPLAPGDTVEHTRLRDSTTDHRLFIDLWGEMKEIVLGLIPEDPSEVEEVYYIFRATRTTIEPEE